MSGVNILSESITHPYLEYLVIAIITGGILLTVLIFLILDLLCDKRFNKKMFIPIFCIIMFGCLTYKAVDKYATSIRTEYKVTIDDTVSYKQFINKYDVLSQDGEILTVVERNE